MSTGAVAPRSSQRLDRPSVLRDTCPVRGPGTSCQKLASVLQAAYADGLLSEQTLAHRLDALLAAKMVEPSRLVGDLPIQWERWSAWIAKLARLIHLRQTNDVETLLALDWTGAERELSIGRHPSCDIRIDAPTVSRRHARLVFRDGGWILQDLKSSNGTLVNGRRVGRCRISPGDRLSVADQLLRVD